MFVFTQNHNSEYFWSEYWMRRKKLNKYWNSWRKYIEIFLAVVYVTFHRWNAVLIIRRSIRQRMHFRPMRKAIKTIRFNSILSFYLKFSWFGNFEIIDTLIASTKIYLSLFINLFSSQKDGTKFILIEPNCDVFNTTYFGISELPPSPDSLLLHYLLYRCEQKHAPNKCPCPGMRPLHHPGLVNHVHSLAVFHLFESNRSYAICTSIWSPH